MEPTRSKLKFGRQRSVCATNIKFR